MRVRLGTRGSPLALAQVDSVAGLLRGRGAEVEVVPIRTSGDRLAHVALADLGGKALFVKEIEDALLQDRIDAGVHSLKDLPGALPPGLTVGAYPQREDPADVLVTREPGGLDRLPAGARVGTSSPRRRALLAQVRPDLIAEPIRGNVDTRLRKLQEGLYDALLLARAGLTRLGLAPAHLEALPVDTFVPAVGQGTLAIETRESDREMLELLQAVDDTVARTAAAAERAFLARLGAGCHTAVAGHARIDRDSLTLTAVVASPDGRAFLRTRRDGPAAAAAEIGVRVAEELLARGARQILTEAETR